MFEVIFTRVSRQVLKIIKPNSWWKNFWKSVHSSWWLDFQIWIFRFLGRVPRNLGPPTFLVLFLALKVLQTTKLEMLEVPGSWVPYPGTWVPWSGSWVGYPGTWPPWKIFFKDTSYFWFPKILIYGLEKGSEKIFLKNWVLDLFSEFFRGVRFLGTLPRKLTLLNFRGGQVPGYPTQEPDQGTQVPG